MNTDQTIKRFAFVWLALLGLLLATWALSRLGLGHLGLPVAMAIAFAKLLLIAAYFMELKWSSKPLWLMSGVGLVWLAILIELTLTDYLTRGASWSQ